MPRKVTVTLLYLWWSLVSKQSMGAVNLMLIIVDDLRPALGCYGDSRARTPHLDRLARHSVLFERAYAQQALCGPSRNSLLTSRRPSSLRLYDTHSYWREAVGNFSTMPEHFKNHGYSTASFGKVFHPGASCNRSDDSPYSWTEPPFHPHSELYKNAPLCADDGSRSPETLASNLVCPVAVRSMPNATLPDIETLRAATACLRERARAEGPFFLAVGFQKPHIPLKYPRRYLKYHPISKYRVPSDYQWASNLSHLAYNPWMDLRQRDDVNKLGLSCPWQKIPAGYARKIIQSYYAAVTYVDDLVGELLGELERLAIRNSTLVVLTSDHGWSLGEHAEWAKYSNFEVALRVPLLLSMPGLEPLRVSEPVELLDLFPTLAELAGLPVPAACPGPGPTPPRLCSEGSSLMPLMRRSRARATAGDATAVSLCPRSALEPVCEPNGDEPRLRDIRHMGYSIRTIDYRYTVWLNFDWRTNRPDWTQLLAEELYDHNYDAHESNNVAASSSYRFQKQHLKRILINRIR